MNKQIENQGLTKDNWNAINRLLDMANVEQLDQIVILAVQRKDKLGN